MIELTLKKDELILIQKLRSSPKYVTLTVEKRPSNENPDGEINRITITESILLKEVGKKIEQH